MVLTSLLLSLTVKYVMMSILEENDFMVINNDKQCVVREYSNRVTHLTGIQLILFLHIV